jgi:hypothetical protein
MTRAERRLAPLLATAALGACAAAAGPPVAYRFASNRDPAEAVQCAANRLRVEGFEVADSAASAPSAAPDTASLPAPGVPRPDSTAPPDSLAAPADPPPTVTVTTLPVGPSIAIRRNESTTEVGAAEWWRVEISTTRDDVGTTIVQSVAGVSSRREGPYREPTVPLQGVVGRISASCTW